MKTIKKIQFHLDPNSKIITKDLVHWVPIETQKKRYDYHHNDLDDPNYVLYQKKIFDEFIGIYLKQGDLLDYGCGEAAILKTFIPNLRVYDLFYHNDVTVFESTYDTIILIEVMEHLENPEAVIQKLTKLLKPKGRLIIQTQFYPSLERMSDWWYVRDVTHVSFYNLESFKYFAARYGIELIYTDFKSRVVLEKTVL